MLRVANSCESEASLEIPWEPRAFSEGQRPSVSFATDECSRLFWERAETDLVEQLAAASERVFDAKLRTLISSYKASYKASSKACFLIPLIKLLLKLLVKLLIKLLFKLRIKLLIKLLIKLVTKLLIL